MATLLQGQSFTDTQGRTGIVNFDTQTGQKLATGATTQSPLIANNMPTSTNVNASIVSPTTNPLSIPTTPIVKADPLPNVASSILEASNVADTKEQKDQKERSSLASLLLPQLEGEAAALALEKEKAGLKEANARKKATADRIYQLQAEVNQDDVKLLAASSAEERRDTLLPFAQSGQAKLAGDAAIRRALKNSEIGMLNAQAIKDNGDVELALQTAKDAVDLKFAPTKERINTYLQQNAFMKDIVSKDDAKQLKEQELRANVAMKQIEQLQSLQTSSIQNAILAGASQSTINAMNKAQTKDELFKVGSKYFVSPKDKLELSKLGLEINKLNNENTKLINEINEAKKTLQGTTGNPVLDVVTASSRYGKQNLSDAQLVKVQQATNSLESLASLQGLLSQGKDGVNSTGPIIGKKRQLLAALGGDKDAAAINATIQGLIPTIARGIFGEVGVLTNADIDNYKKTLPNITSTEDQNKLISIIMYDTLSRSLGTTLLTNAQNQVNVSNFASTYLNAQTKVDQMKAELGVVPTALIAPENKIKLESAWNSFGGTSTTGGVSNQQATEQLNGLLKGLTPNSR